jgi:hypothetical protein
MGNKQDMAAFHPAGIMVHSTINCPLSGLYGEWGVLVTLIWQLHDPQFSHFASPFPFYISI